MVDLKENVHMNYMFKVTHVFTYRLSGTPLASFSDYFDYINIVQCKRVMGTYF